MAFQFTKQYERDVEERMQGFHQTLSEKDRRRYAAVEARKLGRGGVSYVAEVLGCSTCTIELRGERTEPTSQRSRGRTSSATWWRSKKRSKPNPSLNRI